MKVRFFYACGCLLSFAILCLLYGFFVEPKRLVVRHVAIASPHYQGEPLTIALLSDLHIGGRHMPSSRVDELVEVINAYAPDIVLLAGDYIGSHENREERSAKNNDEIEQGLQKLGSLQPSGAIYAVTGNHDNWYDGDWVKAALDREDITVLGNESVFLDSLCIIGMADFDTDEPSPVGYENCPTESNKIVVTHSPDSFRFLRSDTALAVAGHTHGGQINIPLIGRRVTATEAGEALAYGSKMIGDTPVFITAGVGTSILPARFRAPPEIVLLMLRPKD